MPSTHYRYYEDARTSYYEQLVYPTSFENFNEIINRSTYGFTVFKSLVPIKFKNLEYGDSQELIIKKLGKPRFVSETNEFASTTYFYKETLLNHKLLIQLHFFDRKFVLATQSVIDTDSKWRQIVKIIVQEKYSGNEKPIITPNNLINQVDKNLIFVDQEGNRLFLLESINLNIIYSSGDPKLLHLIEEFTTLRIKKISEQESQIKAILKNSF